MRVRRLLSRMEFIHSPELPTRDEIGASHEGRKESHTRKLLKCEDITINNFITKGYVIPCMAWAGLELLVKLHLLHQKQPTFGELGKVPKHSRNRQSVPAAVGAAFP